MSTTNRRCSLRAKSRDANFVFGEKTESNVMYPLALRERLVFPYTPTVQSGSTAEYDEYSFTQSAYKYPSYVKSYPKEILVSGDFTAQTQSEARYLLAVMQFFKSVLKPYFGTSNERAGTPPGIILFNYLGNQQFYDVPVILKDYTYTLEPDVDYVYVETFETYVPTKVNISIALETYYNPRTLRNNFDLDEFREGRLYKGGFI
tara:strand:+ start:6382 stop:6993 length:612 start_codon:yes stop_codon:yes gene_type:complete